MVNIANLAMQFHQRIGHLQRKLLNVQFFKSPIRFQLKFECMIKKINRWIQK